MKTRVIISILAITGSLAAVVTFVILTQRRLDAVESAPGPMAGPVAATSATAADPASSPRINVPALIANLEFLDTKPALVGHPLLIEFWATWCPPCRASIAHLNELERKYHGRGLGIVGITGEDQATVERFRAGTPMDYPVALDTGQAVAAEFQVETIPQAWLLDSSGRVIWSGHPMQLDEQTIALALTTRPASGV